MCMFHLRLSVLKSLILCTLASCVCLLSFTLSRRWGDATSCRYNGRSSGVGLILCPFNGVAVVCSPLRPVFYLTRGSGTDIGAKCGFHLVE